MDSAYRASCRSQITRLVNAITEWFSNNPIVRGLPLEEVAAAEEELTVLLERLKTAQENLNTANENVKPDKVASDVTYFDAILEYDDKATAATTRIKKRLEYYNKVSCPSSTNTGSESNRIAATSIKLPRLELRKFNGNISGWLPFWEQFKTAIHENPSLTSVAKFNYLQSLLVGKAAATIAGFTPTENCYNDALALLKEQYGESDRIIERSMQELMNISAITSAKDFLGIRRLYNTVCASMRSLNALGIPSNHYDIMLKSIIVRALPSDLRVEYYRRINKKEDVNKTVASESTAVEINDTSQLSVSSISGEQQLGILISFLKTEVEALEQSFEVKREIHGKAYGKERNRHETANMSTAAGLFTSTSNTIPNESVCAFCKSSGHMTAECNGSLTMNAKREILKRAGRCFKCTKGNHMSKFCKVKVSCAVCKGRHVTAMCEPRAQRAGSQQVNTPSSQLVQPTDSSIKAGENAMNLMASNKGFPTVLLQTACAYAQCLEGSQTLFVRIVLDGGSQTSFIREDVSRALNLKPTGTRKLSILTFGSSHRAPAIEYNMVRVRLLNQHDNSFVVISAVEVPEICLDILSIPKASFSYNELKGLKLADSHMNLDNPLPGISLLIGSDNYWSIVSGEIKRLTSKLVAVDTVLGWTLQGPWSGASDAVANLTTDRAATMSIITEPRELRPTCVENSWSLEAIGIKAEETKEDNFTEDFMKTSITLVEGRYEVSLPWKNPNVAVHNNRRGALARLRTLTRKLLYDAEKYREYDRAINEYFELGFAEFAPLNCQQGRTYYLPHRAVYRDDKITTRLRIVFDASAHEPGHSSLNDNLWPGENINAELYYVLLNFRLRSIGVGADIEKAFLQVALAPHDRDAHRYLWYKKGSPPIEDNLIEYRMNRVTFGVTSSPFLLAVTIKKHLLHEQHRFPETTKILQNSFYVDDLLYSSETFEAASSVYAESIRIMGSAGMRLRKWITNSDELHKLISEDELAELKADVHKVLGLNWWTQTGEIGVDLKAVLTSSSLVATKRNVLKVIAQIFDPLGILSPCTVKMKLLSQSLWKANLEWDSPLPSDQLQIWTQWCEDLNRVDNFAIPRCMCSVKDSELQHLSLHVFADASPQALGAVAYLRTRGGQGDVTVSFVCSKNRIAPIKTDTSQELTIPKLELTAALIASRLQSSLKAKLNINITETYLWSDSKIALYWIKGDFVKFKPFVRNRVQEIQDLTKGCIWRHCPGEANPADLLTRGLSTQNFLKYTIWTEGPRFLYENGESWPADDTCNDDQMMSYAFIQMTTDLEFQPILSINKYSDWRKLLRVTAYILRFVRNIRKIERELGHLRASDIQAAEIYWYKYIQQKHYPKEYESLRIGEPVDPRSKIATLTPFLDENGLVRVGGRLQEANLIYDTAHPIMLPKEAEINEMLIRHAHQSLAHSGVSTTFGHLRKRLWIVKGRQLVKRSISKCLACKILHCRPASEPFAPLPKERIIDGRPFKTTGIDFAGPLFVKATNDSGGTSKVYIQLFTCAVIRAVHLELVESLTVEDCVRGIRRFIARRGVPEVIYSDNARTFKRAAFELRGLTNVVNEQSLHAFVASRGIEWRFIVERAAWWGGWWERLIRSVKDSLKATIGKRLLTTEELRTILTEIEVVINSRPLSYWPADDVSEILPLTPANFLIDLVPATLPSIGNSRNIDISNSDLVQIWKRRQDLVNKFRRRWSTDYLQMLRSAHHRPRSFSSCVKVGDVVLIHGDRTPRLQWKLGIITTVYPGRDGKIRSCEVRTAHGAILRRPVQLLYPLEIP